MAHINLRDVELRFPVYDVQGQTLRAHVMRGLRGAGGAPPTSARFVTVFSGVSVSICKGDRVALLGRNGAGKSSMLRLIAGIYAPYAGDVEVEGQIGALFEFGGGMEQDLTARENIRRSGILNGLSTAMIERELPALEEMVDIGEFFDRPMRSYSSGMTMRVAFAMSTLLHPQIFLIDEVFGTGDFEFQKRAQSRMENLIDGAEILVFSSHSMDVVRRLCTKAMWLDGHRLQAFGPIEEVIDAYLAS